MDLNLINKNALVCGSSQGLGLAAAIEISLLGTHVTLMARDEKKLEKALGLLDTSKGQQHDYIVADFSYPEKVREAINNYLLSNKTFHILVNNTGGPSGGKAIDAATDDFVQAFNNHLICNHILTQAVVPGMKKAQFGRIVNIISTSVKQPIAGLGVSNTIRAAVANWSKTLSAELAPFGITVNNVLPGFTKTTRADYIIHKKAADLNKSEESVLNELISEIPAKRMGKPEELGAAVAFLCSPAASYINGINLPVDGGRTASL